MIENFLLEIILYYKNAHINGQIFFDSSDNKSIIIILKLAY